MTALMILITNFLKNKSLVYLIILSLIIGISFGTGYKRGYSSCRDDWNKYIQRNEEYNVKLTKSYLEEKQKLIESNSTLSQEIINNEQTYKNNLYTLSSEYNDRLHESEQRANYYKSLSAQVNPKGCSTTNLANHTAKLDRQLTEGINLVRQLTELIKLRDEQLRKCGTQINLLIGE